MKFDIIKKASESIFGFFGGLSTKAILYLLLAGFALLCLFYLYHRGAVSGGKQVTDSYNQGAQQEISKQEKDNQRNAQDAIEQEKDLSSNIATLQARKEALENELATIKSTNKKSSIIITNENHKNDTSLCEGALPAVSPVGNSISVERLHSLQAAIDKANQ